MSLAFPLSLAQSSRLGQATAGREASERAYMIRAMPNQREQSAMRSQSNFQPTQRSIGNHAHDHERAMPAESHTVRPWQYGERYAYVPHALNNADCNVKSRQMLLGGLNTLMDSVQAQTSQAADTDLHKQKLRGCQAAALGNQYKSGVKGQGLALQCHRSSIFNFV